MSFVWVESVSYSEWQITLHICGLFQTNKRRKGTIKDKPLVVKGKKPSSNQTS